MKTQKAICLIAIILILSYLSGCKKEIGPLPVITTYDITEITGTTALCGGIIETDSGSTITERGVCWSQSNTPTIENNKTSNGSGAGYFTSNIINLIPNKTYYVRAYATNANGTGYGSTMTFTTETLTPIITTADIKDIDLNTATAGGNVTNNGGSTVTERGVCWSTGNNPTIANSKTTDGTGLGVFTSQLTDLTINTTYYVRAYATNSKGTGYGLQKSFKTMNSLVISTTTASSITTSTAVSGGYITNDNGKPISARGVCWSTNSNPAINDSHTADGTGIGGFTSNITGLSQNTTYYVRAYATNLSGTSYGNQISFKTSTTPTITTTAISSLTSTTASSGGDVTSDGGLTVTTRGVCWSTSQNPTTENYNTNNGGGTGSFTSNITGLTSEMTYYVRAYATNSAGTSYGNQISFTTGPSLNSGEVWNPTTGKIWMDRNLGATQVATSPDDAASYGSLYQWGRGSDGHQLRNSTTTGVLSTSDTPGHGNFIKAQRYPHNWRSPANINLWDGVNGINNPCPAGFRLPTKDEWENERLSWSSNNSTGAFASPLKLPLARYRDGITAVVAPLGTQVAGNYWSSGANVNAYRLNFTSNGSYISSEYHSYGYSVRCIKN